MSTFWFQFVDTGGKVGTIGSSFRQNLFIKLLYTMSLHAWSSNLRKTKFSDFDMVTF